MRWDRPVGEESKGSSPGGAVADPAFTKQAGALLEFLSVTTWSDGAARVPGSVTIFVEDGRLKACLSDKDAGRVAFVTAATLAELLRRLAEGLEAGSLDWRVSRASQQAPSGHTRPKR